MAENSQENAVEAMAGAKHVRRAILPVLDRTFQVKVTLFALLFVLLSHLLLVAIHYNNLVQTANASMGKSMVEMDEFITQRRKDWARDLVIGFTVVTILVGLGVFYLTQKVSGPLFAMSRVLDEVAHGNVKERVHLRRSDEFIWFAEKLNETLDSLEKRGKK